MFRNLHCRFTPWKYQREILDLVHAKIDRGERRFHVVAPPGSGKTIVGLQLVIDLNRPAIVLAPNAGIQSQWIDKLRFFVPSGHPHPVGSYVSGEPDVFRPIMALTYQSLTTRAREERAPESPAEVRWARRLIQDGEVEAEDEALAFIHRLHTANPGLYDRRIAAHERDLIMELADPEDVIEYLHPNALALIDDLVQHEVRTLVLDECHHLTGYWARVAQAILRRLDDPITIGLTATPPDEARQEDDDANHYLQLVGDIDYHVPTPAVIREGHLAPFQDLVYFCRPTPEELAFVADADAEIRQIRQELEGPPNRLAEWAQNELDARLTPTGRTQDWRTYLKRRRTFCAACRDYLAEMDFPFPEEIRNVLPARHLAEGESRMIILERYVNRSLLLSEDPADHDLARRIRRSARLAGYQITARGLRACASPVTRVLARSRAKADALVPIFSTEDRLLGPDLRAVVITDFERASAVRSDDPGDLIDEESRGAVQAFRILTSNPEVDDLDPILVTGRTVLVDDDLLEKFLAAAEQWIVGRHLTVALTTRRAEGFYEIFGSGPDWNTRNYVLMMTEFLARGLTRCLVGTRGLLGEGWDCPRVNCLVDLTTATTSMTVRQLRGRSIRLDPALPRKVANNWDVICLAPEFQRGLGDYRRFARKHAQFHSLTDDGQIEKGVHHVHAALKGARPHDVALATHVFNEEMVERAAGRDNVYDQWAIGSPYRNEEVATAQVHLSGEPPHSLLPGETPLMSGDEIIAQIASAVLAALSELKEFRSTDARLLIRNREDGYCRAFLTDAHPRDMEIFANALAEIFSPLARQRYMAPRFISLKTHTWLSRLLPDWAGRYFRKKRSRLEMYHPVPGVLGTSRARADVFQKHWNRLVSPGDVLYTRSGLGREIFQQYRKSTGGFSAERFDVWR